MKLIYMFLKHYRPLSLSDIETFEYTPIKKWQLILGTNGSGKSSILRAASPNISDKNEFRLGGQKITHWQDNEGVIYKLTSNYNKSVKHSFIRDDIELNPGGTSTVQNELIETHLNYSKHIHALLTQQIKFTEMNRAQRETLLLDISGVDFTYAMSIWDALKKHHRDSVGAIKHLTVKLDELTANIDATGTIANIREDVAKIEAETVRLLDYTDWARTDVKDELDEIAQIDNRILQCAKLAEKLKDDLLCLQEANSTLGLFDDFNQLKEETSNNTFRLGQISDSIKSRSKELQELSSIVSRIEECPEDLDLEKATSAVNAKRKLVESFTPALKGSYSILDGVVSGLYSQYHSFTSLYEDIPTSIKTFTREEIQRANDHHKQISLELKRCEDLASRLEEKIHHMQIAKEGDVVCPNCSTKIFADDNLSDSLLATYQQQLTSAKADLEKAHVAVNDHKEVMEEIGLFRYLAKGIKQLVNDFPATAGLWTNLGTITTILQNPLMALAAIKDEIVNVEALETHNKDKEELTRLEEYLYLIRLSIEGNTQIRHSTLQDQMEQLIREKNKVNERLQGLTKMVSLYSRLEITVEELTNLSQKRLECLLRLTNAEGSLEVTNFVKAQQGRLGALRKTLVRWDELQNRKADLKADTEKLQTKKTDYEILIRAISPTHGLIGKMLSSSMQLFCNSVNGILSELWEHELALSLPENESKVSFNFNLCVDGELRDDIRQGSEGEQEAINLAVTLVIMAQKRLQGYPLFMDEVGRTFDYTHRKRLLEFVNRVILGDGVGQLLMVNHFSADYGGIHDSDIVVLNSNNIQITGEYNTNVTIT